MILRRSFLALLCVTGGLLPAALHAQAEPALKVDLKPAEITVGGRVEATLTLVWTGGEAPGEPRFPAWQETWGNAEVLEVGEMDSFTDQSSRLIYRQKVVLTAFQVGEVKLPAHAIAIPDGEQTLEVETPGDLAFTVTSVLPAPASDDPNDAGAADPDAAAAAEEPLELRPPVPPLQLADNLAFAITAGCLTLLLGLATWLMVRRLQLAGQLAGGGSRVLLAPLEELLELLRQVDPSAGSEPAHTRLSLALRGFLGRSLSFQGIESTTTEIRRQLRDQPLPPAINQRLLRLLDDCDEVKFARREVEDRTTDERLERAEQLGKEIDRLLRPPEEPTAEVAG